MKSHVFQAHMPSFGAGGFRYLANLCFSQWIQLTVFAPAITIRQYWPNGNYMQPIIVQGDKTSHGGAVLAGSPLSTCDGKPIARVGDMCSCPKCKGVFPIAEGDPSNIVDGAPVSYHGCKTACGASLISSQIRTLTEPSSGGASGAGAGADAGGDALLRFGAVGAGMAAAYEDEPAGPDGQRFQGRFQLVNADDGTPVSGHAVRVRSTEGQYMTGTTDAEGYTQWVERGAAESLAFDLTEGKA